MQRRFQCVTLEARAYKMREGVVQLVERLSATGTCVRGDFQSHLIGRCLICHLHFFSENDPFLLARSVCVVNVVREQRLESWNCHASQRTDSGARKISKSITSEMCSDSDRSRSGLALIPSYPSDPAPRKSLIFSSLGSQEYLPRQGTCLERNLGPGSALSSGPARTNEIIHILITKTGSSEGEIDKQGMHF